MRNCFTFLILAWMTGLAIGIDFHLSKTVKLKSNSSPLKVTALGDDALVVRTSNSSGNTVTYLQGIDYDTVAMEYTSPVNHSQIIVNSKGLYVNNGDGLIRKNWFENYTFEVRSRNGNMVITSKYAILVLGNSREPILQLINLDTMQVTTKSYPPVTDSRLYGRFFMSDLKNGKIVFGIGDTLRIIDNQTLQLKQSIILESFANFFTIYTLDDFSSFYNEITGESAFLVLRNPDYMVWKQDIDQNYKLSGNFYPLYKHSRLTGVNSVVSYTWTHLSSFIVGSSYDQVIFYQWANLNSILDRTMIPNELLADWQIVGVSYSEQYFVLFSQNSPRFQFWGLGPNYEVTFRQSVSHALGPPSVSKFTSDDKFIFIATNEYIFRLAYNMSIKYVNYATPDEYLGVDVHVFPAQYDRFIVVVNRSLSNTCLQLQRVSTLAKIDEILIPFAVKRGCIFGTMDWGLTFAVEDQGTGSRILHLFQVIDDKIVTRNISASITTLSSPICACSKYIVSINQASVTLWNYLDLTVAKLFPLPLRRPPNFDAYTIIAQKNLLFVKQNSSRSQYAEIYDLNVSFERKGCLVTYQDSDHSAVFAPFPKTGILLELATHNADQLYSRSVYNISTPVISQQIVIESQKSQITSPPLFYPENKVNGTQCNLTFYIQVTNYFQKNPHLVRYSHCQQKFDRYPIEISEAVFYMKVMISSDRKYLIIPVVLDNNEVIIIQIRPIDDITNIQFHRKFQIYFDLSYTLLDIDIVNGSRIFIHTQLTTVIFDIQDKENATDFGISNISAFDVNLNKDTAMVGKSSSNSSQTVINVKGSTIFQLRVGYEVQGIALSPKGTLVAVWTLEPRIEVWSTTSKEAIFSSQELAVVKIAFLDQRSLLIQHSQAYQIVDLTNKTEPYNAKSMASRQNSHSVRGQSSQLRGSYDVQMSNDGSLIAQATDSNVKVYSKGGDKLADFSPPLTSDQAIVSVSFSPSSALIVVTSSSIAYFISPTSCPETYQNINLNCVCGYAFIELNGACLQCAFPCKTCSGSQTSCIEYSATFFILISIGAVVLIAGIIIFAVCLKRRRQRAATEEHASTNISKSDFSRQAKSAGNLNHPLTSQ